MKEWNELMTNEVYAFAKKFDVPPRVAIMLPGAFHQGAGETGMTQRELVNLATHGEEELGLYMVAIAEECADGVLGRAVWADFIVGGGCGY